MISFDMNKFTSDNFRLFQLISLAAFAVVSLLSALIEGTFFVFLLYLCTASLVFFAVVPAYLATLEADSAPLGRTGWIALKGAECAGMAGVALVVVALFQGLAILVGGSGQGALAVMFGSRGPGGVVSVLMVMALAGIGMAVGAGLTNLLRNANVELEAPPAPQPSAQAYDQPYDAGQQQYQQPQQYQQYQQPQQYQQYGQGQSGGGGYDPNSGQGQ